MSAVRLREGHGAHAGVHVVTGSTAVVAGVVTDASWLVIAQSVTGARLAAIAGARRTTPRAVAGMAGAAAAEPIMAFLDDGTPEWPAFRRFVAENPDGFLVVAFCQVAAGESRN